MAQTRPTKSAVWTAAVVKHDAYAGGVEKPEHAVWRSMLARCRNPKKKQYPNYGGRGLEVCERWDRYENFIADMGDRPSPAHSLERIDNDKGYNPDNCCWATQAEQMRNTRRSHLYTNGTFTGIMTDCAAHLGISKELAHHRFKTWGTFEKGVTWLKLQRG